MSILVAITSVSMCSVGFRIRLGLGMVSGVSMSSITQRFGRWILTRNGRHYTIDRYKMIQGGIPPCMSVLNRDSTKIYRMPKITIL